MKETTKAADVQVIDPRDIRIAELELENLEILMKLNEVHRAYLPYAFQELVQNHRNAQLRLQKMRDEAPESPK